MLPDKPIRNITLFREVTVQHSNTFVVVVCVKEIQNVKICALVSKKMFSELPKWVRWYLGVSCPSKAITQMVNEVFLKIHIRLPSNSHWWGVDPHNFSTMLAKLWVKKCKRQFLCHVRATYFSMLNSQPWQIKQSLVAWYSVILK